jgi:hypothetical protein
MILLTEIIMLSAIHLNNQFGRQTGEICDIVADDVLSAKRLSHPALLQMQPQRALCFRGTLSHPLSVLFQQRIQNRI